ncbi:MAG: iron-siderophore ABC transporter substrate-binding protein [Leptolyngbya sp. SIO1E4]|nr:iron-siderophore ABC transporter substrate-binding protein [Leptolyngbya sp. SIO1E4]
MPYLLKSCLLIAVSFVLIVACQPTEIQETDVSQAQSTECRTVQHKLGEICIPPDPQRIVALDPRYLGDPLLALGVKPVGMSVYSYSGEEGFAGPTSDDIEGIEIVGNADQPSLEKILTLNPDLILAMDFAHEAIYEQLLAIAPTVLLQYESTEDEEYTSFKVNLRRIAQIVDKEAEADAVLARYQARIEQLRQQLSRQPENIEVAVLIYYDGNFAITFPEHTTHEIFSDIGLTNKIDSARANAISPEVIDQYDADILFIMDYEQRGESFFLENPLITSLEAVKNNRVYFVSPDTWSANGPIGVNRILDDLFKYLPEE